MSAADPRAVPRCACGALRTDPGVPGCTQFHGGLLARAPAVAPPAPESPAAEVATMSEHAEQAMLFQWAALAAGRTPELGLLYAIPNFAGRLGKLTAIHGARLKAEGRKKGVPDLCLPVARGTYHGLYVELKAKGGRPTPEQKDWLHALQAQGYAAHLCVGWEDARRVITDYLALSA